MLVGQVPKDVLRLCEQLAHEYDKMSKRLLRYPFLFAFSFPQPAPSPSANEEGFRGNQARSVWELLAIIIADVEGGRYLGVGGVLSWLEPSLDAGTTSILETARKGSQCEESTSVHVEEMEDDERRRERRRCKEKEEKKVGRTVAQLGGLDKTQQPHEPNHALSISFLPRPFLPEEGSLKLRRAKYSVGRVACRSSMQCVGERSLSKTKEQE